MKYGIILPSYGPLAKAEDIVATAQAAEEYGYDSIWTTDHILLPENDSSRFRMLYEAIATLAFVAGRTSRVRLGVSSLVLPMRDPLLVARQMSALDALSGGRSMLCVSVGWSRGEYENLGYDFHNRGARLDEAIKVMRLLWDSRGETVSHSGEFFQFECAIFDQLPVQKGGPELWVGGNSLAARKRAARFNAVWHPSSIRLEDFSEGAASFRELSGGSIPGIAPRLRVTYGRPDPDAPLCGSPSEIRKQLKQYTAAGMTGVLLSFNASGQAQRESDMKAFMENVVQA